MMAMKLSDILTGGTALAAVWQIIKALKGETDEKKIEKLLKKRGELEKTMSSKMNTPIGDGEMTLDQVLKLDVNKISTKGLEDIYKKIAKEK